MCTRATAELLYPTHVASCVYAKKVKLHWDIFISLCLHPFAHTHTQMWHKYLAVALTWTNSTSVMGRLLPFWFGPSLSVDFIVFLVWHYPVWHLPAPLPSFFIIIQLSVGRRKNESWELSAWTPRGVFFLLPCVSQAGCFCVRGGCCLNPTGGSAEVKEVGYWGWASRPRFRDDPFWLPAAFSLWR